MRKGRSIRSGVLMILIICILTGLCFVSGCGQSPESTEQTSQKMQTETSAEPEQGELPDRDGSYDSRDDVALYLYVYGELPGNYITKKEARALGWDGGRLEPYAPGKCIGGDHYGNYEGLLPDDDYRECDIDTMGKKRGPKRLVYSDDAIYYTEDHYGSFTQLYDENGEL